MANTKEAGRLTIPAFERGVYFSGSTDYSEGTCVCYDTSNADYVIFPEYSGQEPAGIVKQDIDYATWNEIQTAGKAKCIASEAISLYDYVSIGNTSGQLKVADYGEWIVGRALQEAADAASKFEVELMIGCQCLYQFVYTNAALAADTSFTVPLPAGDYRVQVLLEETAGNALGGGLDIGTTDGGAEIAAALTIGASTRYDYAAGSNFANVDGVVTLTAGDTIYITDADGTGWDNASLKFWMKFERVR